MRYLALILFAAIGGIETATVQKTALCGVSFELPPEWTVRLEEKTHLGSCALHFRPRTWSAIVEEEETLDLGSEAFSLHVFRGTMEQVAGETLFEKRGRQWVVLGRLAEPTRAEPVKYGEFTGVRAHAQAGVMFKEVGVATSELLRVFVAHRSGLVVYVEAGPYWADDEIEAVLRSLRPGGRG